MSPEKGKGNLFLQRDQGKKGEESGRVQAQVGVE